MKTFDIGNIEHIRESHRPNNIRILFVGESPPKIGKFFYVESLMTTFISKPFELRFNITFNNNQDFIDFFKNKDCYLDDLCTEPVDKLPPNIRKQKLIESVKPFSKKLAEMKPLVVISILKRIEPYVVNSIELSGIDTKFYSVPFPGFGNQKRFKQEVLDILNKYLP